jgi:hypothetical protein
MRYTHQTLDGIDVVLFSSTLMPVPSKGEILER